MYKVLSILTLLGIPILSISMVSSQAGAYSLEHIPLEVVEESSAVREEAPEIERDFETLEVVEKMTDIEYLIRTKAREAGVNEETALRIAKCESGLNPEASNSKSTATGLYQFLQGSWKWIGAEEAGLERANPEHSLQMFLKWYPKHPSWWECQ